MEDRMAKGQNTPVRLREVQALDGLPHGGRHESAESGRPAVLFCLESSPRIVLRLDSGRTLHVQRGDVLLLREPFTVASVPARQSLSSILVLLEGEDFPSDGTEGALRVQESFWGRGILEALETLGPEDLSGYCQMKVQEMAYLLERGGLALRLPRADLEGEENITRIAEQGDRYIRGHMSGDLSIARIARMCGVSPTALKKSYRSVFGISVHAAVIRCRMEEAERLLTSTSLTVRQVALQVGYTSVSQFSAAFRRMYSMSPASCRGKNV